MNSHLVCNVCGAVLNEKNIFDHVARSHCNSYFYKCFLCNDYKGSMIKGLFQHQRDKHECKNYILSCPLCEGFLKPSEEVIMSHIKSVHCSVQNRKTEYICSFQDCKKVSLDSYELFSHYLKVHFPEVTLYYNCTECTSMFYKIPSLFQHKRDKHFMHDDIFSGKTVLIVCNLCSSEFEGKKSFRQHMEIKHRNFVYNCPFKNCDYESKLYWGLTNHVLDKHLSEKICYEYCLECDMSYSNIDSLMQHMRDKHFIEEDFCPECGTYEDDLADHIVCEHDCDEDISCILCSKTFDAKNKFVNHLGNEHLISINKETQL